MSSTSSLLHTPSSWYDAYFITDYNYGYNYGDYATPWYTSDYKYTEPIRAPRWCSFKGVSCCTNPSRADYRRVISISLPACKLEGSLTPLGSLSEIITFDISDNSISGSIPPSFYSMPKMEHLFLRKNLLTGSLPPITSTNGRLKTLKLNANRLTGRIPESMSNLKALSDLNTADNKLVGTIPSSLAGTISMTSLFLCYSRLTGTIPSTLRRLTNLQHLDLGNNLLTGTIPVLDQNSLTVVDLIINYLTMGSLQEVPLSTFAPDAGVYLHTNSLVFRTYMVLIQGCYMLYKPITRRLSARYLD